jgi:ADP-heptose:LPS heptosyltransferase
MRILFISSSRIGDAIISSGIVEKIRLENPNARITVACSALTSGVFARLPGLERLIIFEKERYSLHWLRLWLKLLPHFWNIVVDARGSATALFLATGQRKILKGGRRPGRRYLQLAQSMGFSPAPLPVVWTAPADDARAADLLGEGSVIALAPTASRGEKIWPQERFAAVFHALAPLFPGARAAVFAGPGPGEAALAAPLLAALPGALNLVGKLSLPEVAACMRRCKIFIGNDSGLMHIAAAAGTPTLGLFGCSQADEYAPAGLRTAVVLAPGPAGAAPMQGLSVERVIEAAKGLLCA